MKRIAIVGAGQSGLQLGLGLLQAGYQVTLYSERGAPQIQQGRVLSSQCMFDTALDTERELGLNFWEDACPRVEGIGFSVPGPAGGKALDWVARLDHYAQSVDQRLKIPRWMQEFEKRGGRLLIQRAGLDELEECARTHDLAIVATGRGDLGNLFARDEGRSPYRQPQRSLGLTYVKNLPPSRPFPAVRIVLIPGAGEYFAFPALTLSGPCQILVFEAIPGGPMDVWTEAATPEQHLQSTERLLAAFLPWEKQRLGKLELTDENGILAGGLTPTVNRPIAALPSGRLVLGMGDAVVLNDPLTGQGSNNAAHCAELYLESILERGAGEADREWMQQTFDRYWTSYARWVTEWTNLLLARPPHLLRLLDCAGKIAAVGSAVVNGFDDPRTLFPWFLDAEEASAFVRKEAQAVAERFDRRDYRRALGQFATGVTVVTARAADGRPLGMTVNSFTSVSLDPPLILWSVARQASSFEEFAHATHFAVNVLESRQHHLSRQFSTQTEDKFAGVDYAEGPGGCPLLKGVLAHFICRNVRQYDGGDHLIMLGEVEQYRCQGGEPLVFHSGHYRVATRHPDIPE